MERWSRFLCLMSVCICCHGAYANEAVKEANAYVNASATAFHYGGYGDTDRNTYSLEAGMTAPITGSDYFGYSVNGGYLEDREKWSADGWNEEFKTKEAGLGMNLILRDPDTGGILAGYGRLHERWSGRYWGNGWNGRYSDSASANVWTLKGEYYSGPVTLALRQQNINPSDACCDRKESGVAATFYPFDNHLVKATASRVTYDLPQGFPSWHDYWYQAGFESQPEMFDGRLKIGGGYAWSDDDRSGAKMLSARYYWPQYAWMNSVLSVGVQYQKTDNRDMLMLEIGFTFDNRISLKERDRKYLFGTGL